MANGQSGVVRKVRGILLRIGGQQHSGWLPAEAAIPLPTPSREVMVDIEIEFDGVGYLLLCRSQDGLICWDTWHLSLEDAESQAARDYGVHAHQWTADS